MSSTRDITLAIRAKDDATAAINAAGKALAGLIQANEGAGRSATQASGGMAKALETVLQLDRAAAGLAGKFDAAKSGLAAQADAIATTTGKLAAVRGQMESAAAAADRLRVAIVEALVNGGDATSLRNQLATAEAAMRSMGGEARSLERTLAGQKAGYIKAGDGVQALESNLNALAVSQRVAREEAEKTAAAIERQQRAAAIKPTIEATTGITRPGRDDYNNLTAQLRREAARAADAEAAAIARLKSELNPLGVIENRVATESAKLADWLARGKITTDEHTHALALLRGEADRAGKALARSNGGAGRTSFLGLEPYQLQSLGYQVNDLVTQIASGTSATQAFAQQGGQIIQIFPRIGSAIAGAFTSAPILGTVAAFASLVLAIREAASNAERLREFRAILSLNADAASHSAEALDASAKALDRYGMSAEQAVQSVKTLLRDGVDDTRIVQFGQAAQDTADVLGVDLKQATDDVAQAFTGGLEAITKLDDAQGFLTAAQRENIRVMFEEGKAAEARTAALDIYSQKMAEAASNMRGGWASATHELASAWRGLLDELADTGPIKGATNAFSEMARGLADAIRKARGAATATEVLAQIAEKTRYIAELQGKLQANPADSLSRIRLGDAQRGLAVLQQQLESVQARDGAEKKVGDTIAQQTEQSKKQAADLDRVIARAKEKKSLAEVERDALADANRFIEANYKFATKESQERYRQAQLEKARAEYVKKAADESKRESDQRKRDEAERRRQIADGIDNNGREGILATANRYKGLSEKNPTDRGALMDFMKQQGIAVDPKMVAWCAAFVNAVLSANGLPGTGSLSARSFLGYGQQVSAADAKPGDVVVLKRGGGDQGHVGFFQGFDAKGNVRVLGGNQGDKVGTNTFPANDVLGFRRAPNAAQVATEQQRTVEQLQKRQEEYGAALEAQLDRRRLDTDQLREQLGLEGQALLAKQREATIQDAILKATQDAAKAGIDTDSEAFKAKLDSLRQIEGAYFDAAHAREFYQSKVDAAERPVTDLTSLRDSLQEQIRFLRDNGQASAADALQPQLDGLNSRLRTAIDQAGDFYASLQDNPEAMRALGMTADQIEAIRIRLDTAAQSTRQLGTFMGISLGTLAERATNGLTDSIDRFAQSVAGGANVFKSLGEAFRSFASDFLLQIAKMIEQQLAFNLVSGLFRAIGGGIGGGAGTIGGSANGIGAVGGIMAHAGGVVGEGSLRPGLFSGALSGPRAVSPAWFTAAMRYHTGGLAGLRPDEVPAILQRGEEVLTAADARHRANGGGVAAPVKLSVVNAIDGEDLVRKALATRTGEKAILNLIRDNAGAVKQALG